MNRNSSNRSQYFLHRVSPRLFSYLRKQRIRVLRDATQLRYNFHNSHRVLVVAFSSCVGIMAFLWLFVWLFINLMMREQTLIPGFTARFCFVKLTGTLARLRDAPRGGHLSTHSRLFVESLSTGPSASRNTFSVSTITDGYA